MIYIVIPCYIATEELAELTRRTIKSFKETSECYIIAVDDGSPMKDIDADEVLVNETNMGFAKTCNKGLKRALKLATNDDYIVCANNDIYVFDGWDRAMTEPFERFERVGITGLISAPDYDVSDGKFRGKLIKDFKVNKITEGGLLDGWMQSGGLWMTTPSVLKEIGLFDEQFEVGGEEDVDLFLRCRDYFDYKIVMSGKSCFWHREGATRWNDNVEKGYKEKNKAIEQKNYDRFSEKWGFDIRTEGLRFYENIIK